MGHLDDPHAVKRQSCSGHRDTSVLMGRAPPWAGIRPSSEHSNT